MNQNNTTMKPLNQNKMKNNSENGYYDYDNPPSWKVAFLMIVIFILFGIAVNYLCINL